MRHTGCQGQYEWLTINSSISAITGCQKRGTKLHRETHVLKHTLGTRSFNTNGATWAITWKSWPVREPAYCTSMRPLSCCPIWRPETSSEFKRILSSSLFWAFDPSWLCTTSCQKYLMKLRSIVCKISRGVCMRIKTWNVHIKDMQETDHILTYLKFATWGLTSSCLLVA